jgi:dipeptidyl aminopeptidase/acylaminoacyl peptidase
MKLFVWPFAIILVAIAWQLAKGEPTPRISPHLSVKRPAAPDPQNAGNRPAAPGRIYYWMNHRINTMGPDGQGAKDLPPFAGDDDYYYQPHSARISPDGKRLAFGKAVLVIEGNTGAVYPPNHILVREIDKSEPAETVVDMSGAELHNWVWSPDGSKLAFVSWDEKNHTRNWIVDLKSKTVESVTFPKVKTEKYGEIEPGIQAWTPDGGRFLVSAQGLYLAKTNGSDMRPLTQGAVNVFGSTCRFSPDGKRLLYVTYNENKSNTLYVLNVADGKSKAVVEAINFSAIHAAWSPDGRRIAYITTLLDGNGNRGEETSINVIDADGGNSTTIISEKHEANVIRVVLMDWR